VGNTLANAITGNSLADTITASLGNDTLDGGAGIDRLLGGDNDDRYIITDGDVVVEALNQGQDTVVATTGTAHTLAANVETLILQGAALVTGNGNAGANTIVGNALANVLRGLADNDVLVGGLGADLLFGGTGSDQFRIDALAESTVAAPDRILDFSFAAATGLDQVDLRAIDANTFQNGNQAFRFIGSAAFGGTGAASAGELRVVAGATAGTFVASGDVNGNGVADFSVSITSATGPLGAWFLL
jgi:Ca2+-binding RTX toxin-like protein